MNEISYYLPVISALAVPGFVVLVATVVYMEYKRIPHHRRGRK